jgi:hypothetical protein
MSTGPAHASAGRRLAIRSCTQRRSALCEAGTADAVTCPVNFDMELSLAVKNRTSKEPALK